MNKTILSVAFIILTAISVSAQSAPERDTQLWNEFTVSIPIKSTADKLSVFVSGGLRIGQNLRHFIDERIVAGFEYKFNKYFSYSSSYLYRAGQPFKNRKEYEHRVRFDLSIENKWKKFSLKDRNRVEYRMRQSRSDSVRYRNKIQLKIPVKKDGREIFAPFVADEPFYDFSVKKFTRNEFSAGISKKFNKNFSADFYYILQNNRGNSFKYVNIGVVNLKYTVD
ncbi:MAG: DUF2490 domain-containing protein [Pyrinomonadaceae bacterium]